MRKRILSILLAIVMVASCFVSTTITSFAADDGYVASMGDNKYRTIHDAFAAVSTDGVPKTIKLLANCDIETNNNPLVVPKGLNVTLDLNGYQINGICTARAGNATFKNSGNFYIKDSTDVDRNGGGTGCISINFTDTWIYNGKDFNGSYASNVITNYGNLYIESGRFINEGMGSAAYVIDTFGNSSVYINGGYFENCSSGIIRLYGANIYTEINRGKFVAREGKVTTESGEEQHVYGTGIYLHDGANKTLVINGGTFDVAENAIYDLGNYFNSKNSTDITINGGSFNAYSYDVYAYYNAKVTINDGNFESENYAVYACDDCLINGGTFTAGKYALYSYAGDCEINGGSFTSGYITLYPVYNNCVINGGTFNASGDYNMYLCYAYSCEINDCETFGGSSYWGSTAVVNGGTFHECIYTKKGIINNGFFDGGFVYPPDAPETIYGGYYSESAVYYTTECDGCYGKDIYWHINMVKDLKDTYGYAIGEHNVWFHPYDESYSDYIHREWYLKNDKVDLSYGVGTKEEGLKLVGWSAEPNSDVIVDEIVYEGKPIDLYGVWEQMYPVVFNSNGADDGRPDPDEDGVVYAKGEDIAFPGVGTMTKEGYTFVGWNTDKDAKFGLVGESMQDSEMTFYAIWIADGEYVEDATVTVDTNEKPAAVPTTESLEELKKGVEETVAQDTDVIVTVEEEEYVDTEAGQKAIKAEATKKNKEAIVEFLDITVQRFFNKDFTNGVAITNTGSNILEFILKYDLGARIGLTMYRYHDGKVLEFIRTDADAEHKDGTFYYDTTAKEIHFFGNKFSDYAVKTEEVPADVRGAKYYASLTLNNSIDINFALRGSGFNTAKHSKLHVYCDDVEFTTKLVNGDVEGIITAVKPCDMKNSYHIKVVYNGLTVKEYDYSVRKYCDTIFKTKTFAKEPAIISLCYATLAYGAAAETYEYGVDSALLDGLDETNINTALKDFEKLPSLDDYTPGDVVSSYDAARAQLESGSKISMKFYIKTFDNIDLDKFVVFNNEGLRVADSNMTVERNDNWYIITVKNISADRISKHYTLKIKGVPEDQFKIEYGAYDYCWGVQFTEEFDTDEDLRAFISALYVYGQAAANYTASL